MTNKLKQGKYKLNKDWNKSISHIGITQSRKKKMIQENSAKNQSSNSDSYLLFIEIYTLFFKYIIYQDFILII